MLSFLERACAKVVLPAPIKPANEMNIFLILFAIYYEFNFIVKSYKIFLLSRKILVDLHQKS